MNPRLVVEIGDSPGTQFEIPPVDETGPTILGRSSICAIRLPDPKLSRQHCRFTFDGERLLVEDLNSKNGTQVNGPLIQGITELHDGDRVEVGSSLLVVRHRRAGVAPQDTITAALPLETAGEKLEAPQAVEGVQYAGYWLGQKIYEGTTCIIYRARDQEQRDVAVKVLRPGACSSEELVARFLRGGKAAMRLRHPHLVRVLEVGESGGVPFQAMEYVDGSSLRHLVEQRRKALELPQAIAVVRQMLVALQYLYEQGFVMRNVQPGNVLLTGKFEVRLADYDSLKPLPGAEQEEVTQITAMGPFDDSSFAAPEVITRPVVVDQRCDIFGAGACLYFMLTTSAPFTEAEGALSPYRAFRRTLRDARELNPQVPARVWEIMAKAMSDYLDRRYRTPQEMLADLEEV